LLAVHALHVYATPDLTAPAHHVGYWQTEPHIGWIATRERCLNYL
jgi:hypothetical protein